MDFGSTKTIHFYLDHTQGIVKVERRNHMQQLGQGDQQIVEIGSVPHRFIGTIFNGSQDAIQRWPRVVAVVVDRQQQSHQIDLEIGGRRILLLIQQVVDCLCQ